MNASKEECSKAIAILESVMAVGMEPGSPNHGALREVREFLGSAHRKLPSEAAYNREKNRRKAS